MQGPQGTANDYTRDDLLTDKVTRSLLAKRDTVHLIIVLRAAAAHKFTVAIFVCLITIIYVQATSGTEFSQPQQMSRDTRTSYCMYTGVQHEEHHYPLYHPHQIQQDVGEMEMDTSSPQHQHQTDDLVYTIDELVTIKHFCSR